MKHKKNFWCRNNLHKWSIVSGKCDDCGDRDYLLEEDTEVFRILFKTFGKPDKSHKKGNMELAPCKGQNSNVCVAEGCYGKACVQ